MMAKVRFAEKAGSSSRGKSKAREKAKRKLGPTSKLNPASLLKPAKKVKPKVKTAVATAKAPAKPLVAAKPRIAAPPKVKAPKPQPSAESTMLKIILAQLEDAKAEAIVAINLDGKTAIADNMVVASGRSNRHVGAIADQLVDKLKASGHRHIRVEGMDTCDWVLVDAVDVIVHLFRPEVRSFYNLEKLWSEHSPQEPRAD
jgi:ribosome-associated protein